MNYKKINVSFLLLVGAGCLSNTNVFSMKQPFGQREPSTVNLSVFLPAGKKAKLAALSPESEKTLLALLVYLGDLQAIEELFARKSSQEKLELVKDQEGFKNLCANFSNLPGLKDYERIIEGATIFHLATYRSNILSYFIQCLSPEDRYKILQIPTAKGKTILERFALSDEQYRIIELLDGLTPEQKCTVLSFVGSGETAIVSALMNKDNRLVVEMLKDLNSKQISDVLKISKNTAGGALGWAIHYSNDEIIEFLFKKLDSEQKCDLIKIIAKDGQTVLHSLAHLSNQKTAKALLEWLVQLIKKGSTYHANLFLELLNKKDNTSKTALECVRENMKIEWQREAATNLIEYLAAIEKMAHEACWISRQNTMFEVLKNKQNFDTHLNFNN